MEERLVLRPLGDNPPQARLLYGQDVRASLRLLDAESVQVVCTSPPYWGLRDYEGEPGVWGDDPDCDHEWGPVGPDHHPGQVEQTKWKTAEAAGKGQTAGSGQFCVKKCGAWLGQLGLEPTPQLYVQHMVEVFEEIRRVLRPDGTVWLNIGDSYSGGGGYAPNAPSNLKGSKQATQPHARGSIRRQTRSSGLKPKDLVGVPWRAALGLQDAGWYLRNDIIWSKGNPMPESVQDRCTRSHEYIFLLTKQARYFFDAHAISEPLANANAQRTTSHYDTSHRGPNDGGNQGLDGLAARMRDGSHQTRNKRTVWNINPKGYPGAHFAVWPEKLVEPMVMAGSSEHGCCSKCRAPYERLTDAKKTVGWEPTCGCEDSDVIKCVVLDPFSGSATTGAVAMGLERDYIGIDLQPEYLELAEARLQGQKAPRKKSEDDEPDLIGYLFG